MIFLPSGRAWRSPSRGDASRGLQEMSRSLTDGLMTDIHIHRHFIDQHACTL